MKSLITGLTIVLGFILALLWMPPSSHASSDPVQCSDFSDRGHLNVLTINLLFSEIRQRETRLERVVDFIEAQADADEPVDLVLLQEVVGGSLSGTTNTALDLKSLLSERGLHYNLSYRLANGLPGALTVGNAILSRCEIVFTLSKTLPIVTEEPFDGFEIPLRRKVIMSRISVPDFGKINVYNTHLCAFCDPQEERLEQAEVLMRFIRNVERRIGWDGNPIILGGDFNTNLNIEAEIPVYDLITNEGFIDSYAVANQCTSCCSEDEGLDGCTFAVSGNPFTGASEDPIRIDYIFARGVMDLDILSSQVVFKEDPNWVSDHSGVLTRIRFD